MFTFETSYKHAALTALSCALRKSVRKNRSKRGHIFGIVTIVSGLFFVVTANEFRSNTVLTLAAILLITIVLLFEDQINGFVAKKRGLPGMEYAKTTFRQDGYCSETSIGTSSFRYSSILYFLKCGNYFVFVFSPSHGQVYDCRTLRGGSEEAFVQFIEAKTCKELEIIR